MAERAWHDDLSRVVRVDSPDGPFEAYLRRPTARGRPAIVVLHEVFGVNADLRSTCDELGDAGFTAICPELFWRQQHHVDLSPGAPADWEKGMALYAAFDIDAGGGGMTYSVVKGTAYRLWDDGRRTSSDASPCRNE